MHRSHWLRFAGAVVVALVWLYGTTEVRAQQKFEPKSELSDGKEGRPWGQWKQNIQERAVTWVVIYVQRISGGDDTFVNLRYGHDGETFEGGRRIHLTNDKKQKFKIDVGGKAPKGEPLVLNAYKGVVRLNRVDVYYQK